MIVRQLRLGQTNLNCDLSRETKVATAGVLAQVQQVPSEGDIVHIGWVIEVDDGFLVVAEGRNDLLAKIVVHAVSLLTVLALANVGHSKAKLSRRGYALVVFDGLENLVPPIGEA